jgi:hypothetical protein
LDYWSISSTQPCFKSDKTVLLTKDGKRIIACLGTAKECQIPVGVKAIESGAFEGCSSLTSVTIPEGVTEIGSYAFSECDNLMTVSIPDSVTLISSYAFDGCPNLTIYAPRRSMAEKYSAENSIPFASTN